MRYLELVQLVAISDEVEVVGEMRSWRCNNGSAHVCSYQYLGLAPKVEVHRSDCLLYLCLGGSSQQQSQFYTYPEAITESLEMTDFFHIFLQGSSA